MKIIHIGGWKIKSNATQDKIDELTNAVIAFKNSISGILESYAGPLRFFELPDEISKVYNVPSDPSWLARGYNYGLYICFMNEESRRNYDKAKPHLDLSQLLIPLLDDGMNSVLTIDMVLP